MCRALENLLMLLPKTHCGFLLRSTDLSDALLVAVKLTEANMSS